MGCFNSSLSLPFFLGQLSWQHKPNLPTQNQISISLPAMATVKIINRSSNPAPAYATADSAGVDLRANLGTSITLQPLERKLIPTGLYMELPSGYEAQVRPRSGLAYKSGITVLNSPGTIDADYRGEVGVILVNLSNEPFTVNHGDRIAQMVVAPYTRAHFELTQELADSERGAGGFGHTGVK